MRRARGGLLAAALLTGGAGATMAQGDPLAPMRAALDACAAQPPGPVVARLHCASDAMRRVPETHPGRSAAVQHANRLERIAVELESGRVNEAEAMRRAASSEAMAQQEWDNGVRSDESQRARRRVE